MLALKFPALTIDEVTNSILYTKILTDINHRNKKF